ncbi:hypothetical protein HYH03_002790 [Edaphochlamys debaryana]|uniref:Uncharacterized protein n=1 Tax=Edaphochlamys debaryana TaxID=47281 RepID=A0A836C4W9_9CHLO|nr:hypothetical protein HYH03_002790 [Edaphochlamys debaryana]|eukprot:KAG2499209.1 hypothetical protein HYH03_002790 [Edaphochlamys debaryana]
MLACLGLGPRPAFSPAHSFSGPNSGLQPGVHHYSSGALPDAPSESLQFSLEASPPGPALPRAFARAVCVPFAAPANAPPRPGLEVKVRLAVMEQQQRGSCQQLDLHVLAASLNNSGLCATVEHPAPPSARNPLTTRSIRAPFLLVRSEESLDQPVLVDPHLREHLAVAPCTPAYEAALAANVPDVFVGALDRLAKLVTGMAAAIALNFASQGLREVPPWRRTPALLCRWSVAEDRQRELLAQTTQAQGLGLDLGLDLGLGGPLPLGPAVTTATDLVLAPLAGLQLHPHTKAPAVSEHQPLAAGACAQDVAGPEGQVHGATAAAGAVNSSGVASGAGVPARVVRGFEVRSDPPGPSPPRFDAWRVGKPGAVQSLYGTGLGHVRSRSTLSSGLSSGISSCCGVNAGSTEGGSTEGGSTHGSNHGSDRSRSSEGSEAPMASSPHSAPRDGPSRLARATGDGYCAY